MRNLLFVLLACAAAGIAGAVLAHEGATGIVRERMDAMSAMKDAMTAVGRMLKGESPFDAVVVGEAAETIIEQGERIAARFPDNQESRQHPSEAREAIWAEFDRFEALAGDTVEAAIALSSAAADKDRTAIADAFATLGKTCSACHEDYRKPE
ncbi:MAG: cytochrome c [Nitratireductor sp.]|nr:cytochrome c [Nitratireductor sp.]